LGALHLAVLRRHPDRVACHRRPRGAPLEQLLLALECAVLRGTYQQVHIVRPAGELIIDVAVAVLYHREHRRVGQYRAGGLRPCQPSTGLFLIGRAPLEGLGLRGRRERALAFGAVDHLGTDQSNQPTLLGVHRDNRMHQHTKVLAIPHGAEAALAPGVGGVIQLRGIRDRQHVPPGRALGGLPAGMDQHLAHADRRVVEEAVELAGLAAVLGQCVQAHGPLLLHRRQQAVANLGQAAVAKAAELWLIHPNRVLPVDCPERIAPARGWEGGSRASTRVPQRAAHASAAAIADPDSTPLKATDQDSGNSIRSCGTAVGQVPGGQAPVGQAACKAERDARGRFAAAPPPVLRGRKAGLARAHAEAAALAPWKAAIARARLIKRVMESQDRAARGAKPGRGPMHGLPPGTCPGGGTVRPDGKAGEGSDTNSMNRGAGGATAGVAGKDSDTNSMNSGAGGGTAGARAEAPAAAVAPKDGAACEGSDTNSMNSGAGGGTAGARADAPAAAQAPERGAAGEDSDTNSMNSGAGGGTAGARAEAPAAAVAPKDAAACEGSDTNSMNSGAGGGTVGGRAEIPAAALATKGGAACESSDTNSMNSGAGGGTAGA